MTDFVTVMPVGSGNEFYEKKVSSNSSKNTSETVTTTRVDY